MGKGKRKAADKRLPHANSIELLACFNAYIEACAEKTISDKASRTTKCAEAYVRHLELLMSQIQNGSTLASHVNPQWIDKKWVGGNNVLWTPLMSAEHRAADALESAVTLIATCRKVM
jgi:hypothetical protein